MQLQRRQHRPMAYRLAWEEPRAVVDLVHVESSLRGTWEVSPVPGLVPGRLGKATAGNAEHVRG